MKKLFPLTHPKKQPARQLDAIKGEINKYLKRERKKALPENTDFWDFDCRYGASEASAKTVHVAELSKSLDGLLAQGLTECYVEILAKAVAREAR